MKVVRDISRLTRQRALQTKKKRQRFITTILITLKAHYIITQYITISICIHLNNEQQLSIRVKQICVFYGDEFRTQDIRL